MRRERKKKNYEVKISRERKMRESKDRMDGENEERVERMLRERKKRNGEGNTN